jgi:hypothetical protein
MPGALDGRRGLSGAVVGVPVFFSGGRRTISRDILARCMATRYEETSCNTLLFPPGAHSLKVGGKSFRSSPAVSAWTPASCPTKPPFLESPAIRMGPLFAVRHTSFLPGFLGCVGEGHEKKITTPSSPCRSPPVSPGPKFQILNFHFQKPFPATPGLARELSWPLRCPIAWNDKASLALSAA